MKLATHSFELCLGSVYIYRVSHFSSRSKGLVKRFENHSQKSEKALANEALFHMANLKREQSPRILFVNESLNEGGSKVAETAGNLHQDY